MSDVDVGKQIEVKGFDILVKDSEATLIGLFILLLYFHVSMLASHYRYNKYGISPP
jgi:hypothetical protein